MEDVQRERRLVRRDFSKCYDDMEASFRSNPQVEEIIQVNFKLMSDTYEKLVTLDGRVLEEMFKENKTEAEEDAEADGIREFRKKFESARVKKEKLFPAILPPSGAESVTGTTIETRMRNFKLHPVKPKQFSGEIKDWLSWWAQFQKINDDPHMAGSDKFWYLLDSLKPETEAFEIASGYPQSNDNYPIVIEALTKRYGKEDVQLQVYIRELLSLVITNAKAKEKTPVKSLFLKLDSHLRALKTLNLEKADPSTWLFPLVESSLPDTILDNWNRSALALQDGSKQTPPRSRLDNLMTFLEMEVEIQQKIELSRAFGKEQAKEGKPTGSNGKPKMEKRLGVPTLQSCHVGEAMDCGFCGRTNHLSENCYGIRNKTYEQKIEMLRDKKPKRCFRCTGPHIGINCKANVKCDICKRRHLTVLCRGPIHNKEAEGPPTKRRKENEPVGSTSKSTVSSSNLERAADVILQTVAVRIKNGINGEVVRAFIDSGSQRSYILKSVAGRLNLTPITQERVVHSLFGDRRSSTVTHNIYAVELQSIDGDFSEMVEVRDQEKICGDIRRLSTNDQALMRKLSEKNIALSEEGAISSQIGMLIGADLYASVVTGEIRRLDSKAVAIHTKLGWSVIGSVSTCGSETLSNSYMTMSLVDSSVTQLWELEVLGIRDGEQCSQIRKCELENIKGFAKNISRLEDGRYSVKLPWKEDCSLLPSNREVAVKRLQNATRKLKELGRLKDYGKMFDDWAKEKFIEEVPVEELLRQCHYLPHRAVVKPGSLTTPVRPVFDASCRVGKNPSLNDLLHTGENYVLRIPELILGFREKRIGFISDIRKAFQMIAVQKKDCDMMRFLWWVNEDMVDVKEYRHVRVIFGATCSPFILSAVLHHHLTEVVEDEMEIGRKLYDRLYIDNLVSSEDTLEEYRSFREIATRLISAAQMDLRMWMSNVDEFEEAETHEVSVLGMQWDRVRDELFVMVKAINIPEKITKRVVLSEVQKIFDPVGITCPAVLPMKILLQSAWITKKKWDEELSEKETKSFVKWGRSIPILSQIRVPRWITSGGSDKGEWSIHVCTDASKDAYSAVIFLRVECKGSVKIQLVAAKSRVAPMKELTIPKLELMGCLIGARLYASVKKTLDLAGVSEYFWTDSTTALAWIQRENQWGTFVANRTREIRKLTEVGNWRYLPGKLNPADLPSRGCNPSDLVQSKWWEGPEWLYGERTTWTTCEYEIDEAEVLCEMKKTSVTTPIITSAVLVGVKKQYKYMTYVRILGWMLRFIHNSREAKKMRRNGPLSQNELERAELSLIRKIQREYFSNNEKQSLWKVGKCDLETFEDQFGVLRVKSRLTYLDVPEAFKYPVLLPGKCEEVFQLIRDTHNANCHAGAGFLLSELRKRYWILKARRTINGVIAKCFRCTRYSARSCVPKPAPLPLDRIKDADVYEVVGIDAAGPLILKSGRKVWIIIFTCAVYRAVHFDLVTSMTTRAFVRVLGSFVRKYRRPAIIYCDNGTNFRGAANLFKGFDWKSVTEVELTKEIEWKFSPAGCPWYGAFWERMIRTTKDLLRRTVGKATLNHKELEAVMCSIEDVINKRPLTYVSENPLDLEPLTPFHFLHPFGNVRFPEGDMTEAAKIRFRYKYVTTLKLELRNRFLKEYLALLVNRYTKKNSRDLRVGELVLVGSDDKKRLEWPLGRVLELMPGADGNCRVAKVKVERGVIVRAVQRLFPLEMCEEKGSESEDAVNNVVKTRSGRLVKIPERFVAE